MSYEQAIKDGQLAEALAGIEAQVRLQPAEPKHRIVLFQLLVVLGKWERAAKQLDVIGKLDVSALAMVHMYQSVISCELFRESVFRGAHDPVFMGQPSEWQALLLQAFRLTVQGRHDESATVRERAFELAPVTAGKVNGQHFSWIADADTRLGPVLDLIVEGKYLWVSFEHIAKLQLEEPSDLRDLVWLPGHVKWKNGGEAHVMAPVRYPGSEREDALALGRMTQWDECATNMYLGYGQKILATDGDEYPILDIRELEFSSDTDG